MTKTRSIPIAHPTFRGNEKKYVQECLDTSWVSSIGRFIPLFESSFAEFCDVQHAAACNSGTSALHLALLAVGVGPEDEVIIPSLTYVATANAVRYCGGRAVFVDSEPRTMNIDPGKIEAKITERTKAIVVVHLYGHPVDMESVLEVARIHGLPVVEDAAEAHGALHRGKKVGGIGDIATFSFYGNKLITTGEGGMVTTNDQDLDRKVRLLRGQGMDPQRRYWFPIVGYNYRMTNIAAAIGLAQMENIDEHLESHRIIARSYHTRLVHLENFISLPTQEKWATHAHWAYTIVLKDTMRMDRDTFMTKLAESGVETRPTFYPIHLLPPYYEPGSNYPVAERLGAHGVSLPIHGLITEEDIEYIVERIDRLCRL